MTYFRFERHIDSCRKTPYCRRALVSLSVCPSQDLVFTRATLCRYSGCSPVYVRLYVSVTSRCSVETDELIELVFGRRASFHLSFTVL